MLLLSRLVEPLSPIQKGTQRPVSISQVLRASQDLSWVMNSTNETSVSSPCRGVCELWQ